MEVNRKTLIKALVGTLIVAGSILSFGIKFLADDAALSVDRPTFIKVTPDSKISLQIGNTLYFIDKEGLTNRIFNLEEKGFRVRGGYDFFSNGDLLIYNSHEEPTTLEKLSQFARIKEIRQEPVSGSDGLYRCDKVTYDCQLFTTELPAFYTTFRVFIDRSSDTVYIADTPRFVLYKLNKEGALLAQNKSGLWFPNQILLHNNNLYIANTNLHSIKVARSDTENFGEEIETHETIIDGTHVWPTEVIKTPENWWVGIADNSMDNGRIQIFDKDWIKLGTPLLQNTDADARSLALFGDEIWVTDWTNIKIYRFNLSGKRLDDFSNKEIDQAFLASNQSIKKFKTLAENGLTAFFIVFFIGIVAAFVLEKEETINILKNKQEDITDDIDTEDLKSPPGEGVYWIDNKFSSKKNLARIIFAIFLILTGSAFIPALFNDKPPGWKFYFIFLSLFSLMILIFWAWYRISKTRIGVSGKLLLVDDGQGNIGIGKGGLIKYDKSTLLVNNVAAVLGQPDAPIYPKEEMKQWVLPRMLSGDSVSPWHMYKILWRRKHPSIILTIGVLGFAAAMLMLNVI